MLSSELTPRPNDSIELWEANARLDVDGAHKTAVVFEGTKVLQSSSGEPACTPDGGCLAVVLRTGIGTAQGQFVRTERVSANNLESFPLHRISYYGFLPIFVIAASWYVWAKGVERGLKKSKLLLDCVMIIVSVIPSEPPMELSLAVNASLVALQNYAIFCTEPFRILFAGRVL